MAFRARQVVNVPILTFSSGSTATSASIQFDDGVGMAIFSPSSSDLSGTTYTVQLEPTTTGTTWRNLQSGGSDVTLTALKCLVISPIPGRQLRVLATGTENQGGSFTILKTIDL